MDGEFSIVLFDLDTKELYIGHDPTGVRSLYIGYDENMICASSELKSINNLVKNIMLFPPSSYIKHNIF